MNKNVVEKKSTTFFCFLEKIVSFEKIYMSDFMTLVNGCRNNDRLCSKLKGN